MVGDALCATGHMKTRTRVMKLDLDWEPELRYRRGAPTNLDYVHVFHDFDWLDVFPDNRAQFRNGKCLAQHVREECPEGKTPALLLTDQDRPEQSFTTDAFSRRHRQYS